MRTVAILIGLPACGKTTFSKVFFPGWRVMRVDDYWNSKGQPDPREFWKALETVQDEQIVLDGTFIIRHGRDRIRRLFPGSRFIGYVFTADVQECLARNAARGNHLHEGHVYRKAHVWEDATVEEGFDELWDVTAEGWRFTVQERYPSDKCFQMKCPNLE